MNKIFYLLLFLLLSLGVYVYFTKPCGKDQSDNNLETVYKDSIQGIRSAYEELIRQKDSAAFHLFKRTQEGANRMEGEAIFWKNEARKEKARNRKFTNLETDSLLTLVR